MNKISYKGLFIAFIIFSIANTQTVAQGDADGDQKIDKSLQVHGMIRVRPEIKENVGFSSANKYEFVGQKVWLDIDKILFSDSFRTGRAFIKFQDARIWGGQNASIGGKDSGASSINSAGDKITENGVDLREAWGEIDHLAGPFGFRIGRQRLNYGEKRMVSSLDWANVGITFDALLLKFDTKKNSLHAWASILREGDALDLNNVSAYSDFAQDTYFFGIYDTIKAISGFHIDLYLLSLMNTFTIKEIHTTGFRFSNRVNKGFKANGPFDFTVEAAYQFGHDGSGTTVNAFAGGISAGFKVNTLRIGTNIDVASGDDDPSDSTVKTFHNMFPLNHAYYGQADLLSWQNLMAGELNLTYFATKQLMLKAAYIYAMRYSVKDNWYPASGGGRSGKVVGAIGSTTGADLSSQAHSMHEVDFTCKYTLNKHFNVLAGYSIALRGDALNDKKANSDYHYGFVATTFAF
ncbi:MAG: alginate export family protein [Leptospirales bacterium]